MKPISGIVAIAAALERGDDLEPVCRRIVEAVTGQPNAAYIAPLVSNYQIEKLLGRHSQRGEREAA